MDHLITLAIVLGVLISHIYEAHLINETNSHETIEYVLLNNEHHPCSRKCLTSTSTSPMTCRYNFVVEWYHSLSKACYNCPWTIADCFRPDCIPGDGLKRPVLVVNRRMPGPLIEVCLGDEVIVDVENRLPGDSTTIHWHGQHQRHTPYMDGVPMITQCPIHPGTTFRYSFRASNAGTHFWHSHTGFQRADGAFGGFLVRVPEELDQHAQLYDYDLSAHVMVILDWGREIGLDKFVSHHHNDGDNKPATLLVNGHGRFKEIIDDDNNATVFTPTERFSVEQGYRYRFRVINAGFLNCPIEVSVDNHTLTVISSDGKDFVAEQAESLVTYAGERFDFILNADQPKGLYWIRFSGLMDCDERFTRAHQVAVLQYKGLNATFNDYPQSATEPTYETSKKLGKQINSLNKGTEEKNDTMFVSLPELHALDGWDSSLKPEPDLQYYVSYDFYRIDNPHYHKDLLYGFNNVTDKNKQLLTPQLNHISMKLLPFPLLSQRHQIEPSMFCNESTVEHCDEKYCECTHVVNIPLNAVVELILIDKGFAFDANHPFHLHGHSFRVVAMERLGTNVTVDEVFERDKNGLIKRNLVDAPVKDTVTVPDGGYTILRLHATNPGYWLFHCHIEFHVEVGMAIVFKVGEDYDMPPVPAGFPTCGNFMPDADLNYTKRYDCDRAAVNNFFSNFMSKILPDIYYNNDNNCMEAANISSNVATSNVNQQHTTITSQLMLFVIFNVLIGMI